MVTWSSIFLQLFFASIKKYRSSSSCTVFVTSSTYQYWAQNMVTGVRSQENVPIYSLWREFFFSRKQVPCCFIECSPPRETAAILNLTCFWKHQNCDYKVFQVIPRHFKIYHRHSLWLLRKMCLQTGNCLDKHGSIMSPPPSWTRNQRKFGWGTVYCYGDRLSKLWKVSLPPTDDDKTRSCLLWVTISCLGNIYYS